MAHDVFISHSTRDKPVADAVCAALENAGIRCWVAPRDVQPGRSFAGEITRAIQQSRAMVLIFSAHSNKSSQVLREVQLAVDSQLHILQFRIEEVLLNDDLKYYLSTPHWMDAITPPLERHLERLATSLHVLLGKSSPPPVPQPPEKRGEGSRLRDQIGASSPATDAGHYAPTESLAGRFSRHRRALRNWIWSNGLEGPGAPPTSRPARTIRHSGHYFDGVARPIRDGQRTHSVIPNSVGEKNQAF